MMRKLPESVFEREFDAARENGFSVHLFGEDVRSREGAERALAGLPDGNGTTLLYRGWILTEIEYRDLHAAAEERGYRLVSSPEQYSEVTFFPNYFSKIADRSPHAVWTETPDAYAAWTASRTLGDGPFVIKDHVKSAKHKWLDACFVPKGASRERFEEIAEALRAEQGAAFHGGFVVKTYVPLKAVERGPYEYPTCDEYRIFYWQRRRLAMSHYHDRPMSHFDDAEFDRIAERFAAPLFTMDIARTADDDWVIVDVGAGECSSLPPSLSAEEFYRRLRDASLRA
jgi:hypothetical protein